MKPMKLQMHRKQTEESVRIVQERRRSGAAGKHDSRPNRKRQRGQAERAAIRESE